ncbi:MAG TPA: formate dehydrogenase accessory sulfurtransferase FdhD [Mycobacteriales bacterium]|jgi:FdhD protein|nr:formate dehydrogenase accessory sulfurtransferase FdhD [Mycobacteriales bacterium]
MAGTTRRQVSRLTLGETPVTRADTLAVEEPLELRVGGQVLTVTMRTPGADMDLLAGFLVAEGLIRVREDLPTMAYCAGKDESGRNRYNVLEATLAPHLPPLPPVAARVSLTTSACGLCGSASIDAVRKLTPYDLAADSVTVDPAWLSTLPDRLRAAQQVFERTGGLHAAALFDPVGDQLIAVREDVGRHNAVDKVIGWALREDRLPLTGTVLMVSGRASFELTQKAAIAGIPVMAAVSAPSSLAVDLAAEVGLTLVGFVRGASMVVYTHATRLTPQ